MLTIKIGYPWPSPQVPEPRIDSVTPPPNKMRTLPSSTKQPVVRFMELSTFSIFQYKTA